MSKFKNILILGLSTSVILGTFIGLFYAFHSELYTVKKVEVVSSLEIPPLSNQAILNLAAVPTGSVNLFFLDLKAIEKRLTASEWIERVSIQVKPKDTLAVFITYREPRAIIQSKQGDLALVDDSGRVYGSANRVGSPDLPLLGGFNEQNPERIRQALQLIANWDAASVSGVSAISSVNWDDDRGFTALVSYAMKHSKSNTGISSSVFGRATVDFGTDVLTNLDVRLVHLANVFQYLGEQGVFVRQIWADAGKKIVVKTAHGS